jgi:succinate-semialdehyde dehydrogenase/glutarate-semialdehyde dehydrogenase
MTELEAKPATSGEPDLIVPHRGCLVDGRWIDGETRILVRDKYTGGVIGEVVEATEALVREAVSATLAGFVAGAPPALERAQILARTADLIEQNRQRFVDLMVAETGFTTRDSIGDLERTLVTLRLCAEEATRIVGETVSFAASPGQDHRLGFTIRVPLGVVCCITPFNSPLNTVAHKVAPALAAGNSVILKPSALTPLTAALFCEMLLQAGLPPSLLALVHGVGSRVGAWLVAQPDIAFYSFTGSTEVGLSIQRGAGLRRTQMELGSIASTLVCADAELDRAVAKIANAAFRKAGQVCTSVQRLYVEASIADELTERLVQAASDMPAGNPRDPDVRVGPMISEAAVERASSWIEEARLGQARIACGGVRTGPVLSPTVVTDVRPGMRVIEQEIFAPCVSVIPFTNFDEAVAQANNTRFGLSAGIFTGNVERALYAARTLRFGSIHINETSSARADGMPFGGVKESGFGHEGPKYAVRELSEERLVTFNGQ